MEIEHGFGKGSKKPTDESAPKRYLSAYFLWANKTRPSVIAKNPDSTVGEIGKMLGNLWGKTSAAERSQFEAKAERDKKAYHAKMIKYRDTPSYKRFQMEKHAWKIHMTKKPYPKDQNAPKRPLSSYMLYAGSVRAKIVKENPDMTSTEVVKEQSVMWKALSEEDRAPWVKKAKALKEKYQAKLQRYMKTSDYEEWVSGRDAYKAEMKEKRNRLMGIKKKKRARSLSVSKARSMKRQKVKRSRTPKRRSRRSARRAKAPRASKRSRTRSRARTARRRAARRSRTPKASKRSRSRPRKGRRARSRSSSRSTSRRSSTSRSRSASTSRSASRKSKSPKRTARRRSARRQRQRRSKRSKKTGDETD